MRLDVESSLQDQSEYSDQSSFVSSDTPVSLPTGIASFSHEVHSRGKDMAGEHTRPQVFAKCRDSPKTEDRTEIHSKTAVRDRELTAKRSNLSGSSKTGKIEYADQVPMSIPFNELIKQESDYTHFASLAHQNKRIKRNRI